MDNNFFNGFMDELVKVSRKLYTSDFSNKQPGFLQELKDQIVGTPREQDKKDWGKKVDQELKPLTRSGKRGGGYGTAPATIKGLISQEGSKHPRKGDQLNWALTKKIWKMPYRRPNPDQRKPSIHRPAQENLNKLRGVKGALPPTHGGGKPASGKGIFNVPPTYKK